MFPFKHNRRRGLTLIELLAVVAIMVILIGVAIPLMRPLLENRKVREASRELNAYFVGAQARAAQLQRPVGVWIQRRANSPPGDAESFELFMAEAPLPYSGDTLSARCGVMSPSPNYPSNKRTGRAVFDNNSQLLFSPPAPLAPGQTYFVQNGDLIRLNYRGPLFEIINIDRANGAVDFRVPSGYPNVQIPIVQPPTGTNPGIPYQVYRREIRSSVGALVLPETVTIDLTVSGIGIGGSQFAPAVTPPPNSGPIVIMFHPRGGVDSVRINGNVMVPQGPICLLVGQAEKVNRATSSNTNAPLDPDANLNELTNLWITVNHRTGAVTTAENAKSTSGGSLASRIAEARLFAKGGESMGGL